MPTSDERFERTLDHIEAVANARAEDEAREAELELARQYSTTARCNRLWLQHPGEEPGAVFVDLGDNKVKVRRLDRPPYGIGPDPEWATVAKLVWLDEEGSGHG